MSDYPYMQCEQWREILSAQLDGEETPAERAGAEKHLKSCGRCRSWLDAAAAVTRRARTRAVTSLPDLTDAILAAAPPAAARSRREATVPWRARLLAGLRGALGLLGAMQLVLGLAQIGTGTVTGHLHSGQHLWHESTAWNVAVGAGFLLVAVRRTPPAGVLPMLSVFVATLVLLSVNDLITAQVTATRLVSHGFLLGGYLITVLLSRPSLRPGGSPPQQRQPGSSRWRAQLDDIEQPSTPLRLVSPEPYSGQAEHRRAA